MIGLRTGFARVVSARELAEAFTPTEAEVKWEQQPGAVNQGVGSRHRCAHRSRDRTTKRLE